MIIGLIDVDSYNFPNLALMKISAWHKARGDTVEWWTADGPACAPNGVYDRVYMSRVFDDTYSADKPEPENAAEIIKGGTGYGMTEWLPDEVEHSYPDYSLYPALTRDTAFGFLSRGCFRACPFCAVSAKEGRQARKTADLAEWWSGQRNIKLLDPNLLACPERMELLAQLADSGAWVDFTQGLDCRLLTPEIVQAINRIKVKEMHFAWDRLADSNAVLRGLELYAQNAARKPHGKFATVYVLTNFDTTLEEDLLRIYLLRAMQFDPYVMVYDRPSAPREIHRLQRWCNNRRVFRACKWFEDYNTGGIRHERADN